MAHISWIIRGYCEKIEAWRLISDIEDTYGNIENNDGCYSDEKWFSLAAIVDLIKSCI